MEAYRQLEIEFGKWAGVENVVAVSSGTAALVTALEALQLPKNSLCICPDLTMIACPRAIVMAGLVPIFVDCREDLLMNLELVTDAFIQTKEHISAVMMVSVYGRQYAGKKLENLLVLPSEVKCIEDLAEAHGIAPHPNTDAACWSFYKNKIIAGEEGGCVAFKDKQHADLARQLRTLGFTEEHDFWHVPRGHNYRMSNLHAKPILDSLRDFTHQNYLRQRAIEWYDAECPIMWKMPPRQAPWVYDIKIPSMTWETQTRVVKRLNAEGIQARHCFKPCSKQTEFRECKLIKDKEHIAEKMSNEVMYLPLTPITVTQDSIKKGFDIIYNIINTI